MFRIVAVVALLAACAAARADPAPAWPGNQGWAWDRIAAGKPADLDDYCRAVQAPAGEEGCRSLPATFIEQVLTSQPWRDAIPHPGVVIRNATITGDLDLTGAGIAATVILGQDHFQGAVLLARARLEQAWALDGSTIAGRLDAEAVVSQSDLSVSDGRHFPAAFPNAQGCAGGPHLHGASLRHAIIHGSLYLNCAVFEGASIPAATVDLRGATVDGDVQSSGARFAALAVFHGDWMHVGGTFSLNATKFHASAFLTGATAGAALDLSDSVFDQDLDLEFAHLNGEVWLSGVKAAKDIVLDNVQVSGRVDLAGRGNSAGLDVAGSFAAPGARITGDIVADRTTRFGRLDLSGMVQNGSIDLGGARFQTSSCRGTATCESLTLSRARISGDATLGAIRTPPGGSVDLTSLQVGANLDLAGARLAGDLRGDSLSVQRDLSLRAADLSGPQPSFRGSTVAGSADFSALRSASPLGLSSMTVGGDLSLQASRIDGAFQGSDLTVKRDLQFDGAVIDGPVQLLGASIGNTLHLGGALVAGVVNASRLHVGADIVAGRDAPGEPYGAAVFDDALLLRDAHIGGDLKLGNASLTTVDLTQASLDGALRVDAATTWWGDPAKPQLVLRNARLGTLDDAAADGRRHCGYGRQPPAAPGWPLGRTLALDGLVYSRLGEAMGGRSTCWWSWWLWKDRAFSAQPYLQLASVMSAHGDLDAAAGIQFAGRDREACALWQSRQYLHAGLLFLLEYLAGFGIGLYSFIVVGWVALLVAFGTWMLGSAPGGAGQSIGWRVGASVTRVLPIIEINREFTDFFAGPYGHNLTRRQMTLFNAVAILGWILGLFLLAGMSGLTQHS